MRDIWPRVADGSVKPTIYKVLPITEAAEAHDILYRGENVGKVVGSVKSYAQKSKQAAKEKSRYAMEESPRATSRCFMFMYFLLPH